MRFGSNLFILVVFLLFSACWCSETVEILSNDASGSASAGDVISFDESCDDSEGENSLNSLKVEHLSDDDEEVLKQKEENTITLSGKSQTSMDLLRPRASSFNLHLKSRESIHVRIGWIQFSDVPLLPTEVSDLENTAANRKHLNNLLLADARHGNLENFRELVRIAKRMDCLDPISTFDLYSGNEDSLVFAALHSDNVEMFTEVMHLRGISFEDLIPRIASASEDADLPACKSFFNDEDSEDDDESEMLRNASDTVFGKAVEFNAISIVNLLLDHGARDSFPPGTETAFHLAASGGHETLVKILLDRGGSQVNQMNGRQQTPLMLAVIGGHARTANVILQHRGVSLLHDDFEGNTVFHLVAQTGKMKVFQVLKRALYDKSDIISEADRSSIAFARNRFGETPLDFARDHALMYTAILSLSE
jgi:hypothetical protein